MLEAFTLLGALAASTERIALGTLVLNVSHRQPAVTAVGAATVSAISGRPMLLGLGAGASPDSPWSAEMRAVGQPIDPSLPRRHAAVEQVIETCRRLWSVERPADLATVPRPMAGSALHVGAGGPALARLAGRLADGVNVGWLHPGRAEIIDAARRAAVVARRPPIETTTYIPWDIGLLDPDHPTRHEMADQGIDRLILALRRPDDLDALATHGILS